MIELSAEMVCVTMLGGLLVGVLVGFPLGIMIGGVTLAVGYALYGHLVGDLIYHRTLHILFNYTILAAPLFIYMGLVLEQSGITESLYHALYLWLGGLRGGLGVVTVLVGTILATCVGVISASIALLTIVALPAMIARRYNKSLASGSVCAGGCLGILIPPSIMLVLYGPTADIPVGKLFMAAFIPGFTLAALYCSYILIRCLLQPGIGPAVPPEERGVPLKKKVTMLVTSLIPPLFLILAVLGSIFLGIAPPTEAAAAGSIAALLMALARRSLTWRTMYKVSLETLKLCGVIYLYATLSYAYVGVFIRGGGSGVVQQYILGAPGGEWGAFAVIMFIVLILGMFMEWIGIIFIVVPVMSPIIPVLGFDPLWFALMVCINLQMGFMSPPFAPAIFILHGLADRKMGLNMGEVIRGVIPFIICIMICLGLCSVFPNLILWLPGKMIGY